MVRALNLLVLQVVTTGQSQANPNSLHRLAIYRLSIELVPSSCCRRFHSFTMVTMISFMERLSSVCIARRRAAMLG